MASLSLSQWIQVTNKRCLDQTNLIWRPYKKETKKSGMSMVEVEASSQVYWSSSVVESGFWIHIQALMVSNGSFGTAFFPLIFELMARYTAKNGVNHLLRWYNNKKKLVPATRPCLRMTSRSEMSVQPQFRGTSWHKHRQMLRGLFLSKCHKVQSFPNPKHISERHPLSQVGISNSKVMLH